MNDLDALSRKASRQLRMLLTAQVPNRDFPEEIKGDRGETASLEGHSAGK
jgi:hypothetical protein